MPKQLLSFTIEPEKTYSRTAKHTPKTIQIKSKPLKLELRKFRNTKNPMMKKISLGSNQNATRKDACQTAQDLGIWREISL